MQPNQQLDPQALNLAKAIRRAETGGIADPYNARGASGESGAYQYMPDTWKQWAGQYLGDPNSPLSVENQNKVAYSRIKELKDKGLTPAQIASAWNSGDPDKYRQNWRGVNSQGVEYDTPGYVEKVSRHYNEIKGGGAAVGGSYPAPPEPQEYKPMGDLTKLVPEEKSLGRKAAEFMFPILEDKERTNLQTLGDVGLSALSLVPGLGAAGLGAKAAVQGGKAAVKGLIPMAMRPSTVAVGGGIGYTGDVLSNLSEGDTGTEALAPGIGTALGVGAPLLGRALKGTGTVKRALDDDAMDKAAGLVAPPNFKKNVKQGLKQGLVGKGGGLKGEIGLGLDQRQTRAADSIKELVKKGTLKESDTIEKKVGVVRAEIADTAKNLERQIDEMDVVPVLQPEELDDLLKRTEEIFEESPVLVGDAGVAAKRIYKKFVSFLPKGQDVTAKDLLQARKKLDNWVASEGRTAAFDPKMESAISKGLREIRQGANDLLAEKAPNVEVKKMLQQQSAMYDALDAIIENGWKEVGTTGVGRFFQKRPLAKEIAREGVKIAATGAGLGYVSNYLGNRATEDK